MALSERCLIVCRKNVHKRKNSVQRGVSAKKYAGFEVYATTGRGTETTLAQPWKSGASAPRQCPRMMRALAPAPKRRPRLPPKFPFTPANLPQSLQRNPTKLPPRPRQPVGHIAHRNSIVLRQLLIRNVALEFVGLEESKRSFLVPFYRMVS